MLIETRGRREQQTQKKRGQAESRAARASRRRVPRKTHSPSRRGQSSEASAVPLLETASCRPRRVSSAKLQQRSKFAHSKNEANASRPHSRSAADDSALALALTLAFGWIPGSRADRILIKVLARDRKLRAKVGRVCNAPDPLAKVRANANAAGRHVERELSSAAHVLDCL